MTEKKIDERLYRETQRVKAIRTYNSEFTVNSTREMGSEDLDQGIVRRAGSGDPRLYVDLKKNEDRGLEVDLVFLGEREVRENFEPEKAEGWASFGHIVLSMNHAYNLMLKLQEIVEEHGRDVSLADFSPDEVMTT